MRRAGQGRTRACMRAHAYVCVRLDYIFLRTRHLRDFKLTILNNEVFFLVVCGKIHTFADEFETLSD